MAPRVAPPRVQLGRSAGPSRPVKQFGPLETRGNSPMLRVDTSWKQMPKDVTNVESLDKMKDKGLYREVRRAISRFHSVIGVRETNIVLADLPKKPSTVGQQTSNGFGSLFIVLNKKFFNMSKKKFVETAKEQYKVGWSTKTNKAVAHTVTHELAHALWTNNRVGERFRQAGDEIKKLRRKWLADKKRKDLGYGEYSRKNVDEFWAEVVTKAVHGQSDKYTEAVKEIIKKYKL